MLGTTGRSQARHKIGRNPKLGACANLKRSPVRRHRAFRALRMSPPLVPAAGCPCSMRKSGGRCGAPRLALPGQAGRMRRPRVLPPVGPLLTEAGAGQVLRTLGTGTTSVTVAPVRISMISADFEGGFVENRSEGTEV